MLLGNSAASFRLLPHKGVVIGVFLAAAVILAGPAKGRGDDRAGELPKDGAWVRYEKLSEKRDNDNGKATITIRFVGTVVKDDVTFRWLEMKMEIHEPASLVGTTIHKFLLPERDIWESDKPFEHARRIWVQGRDKSVKQQEQIFSSGYFEERLLWTPGMLKGSELSKEQAKDIEYQRGQLKNSQCRTGERVYGFRQPARITQEAKRVVKYTAWQNPDLPLGFAEARCESELFVDNMKRGQSATIYRIQDFGTDAKSELPDNN